MAGITGAFGDALNRKYANLEAATAGENRLRDAQALGITGALPSENALRSAQANSQNAAAATVRPLADSSIAAQQAQSRLQGAQGQYYGAESGYLGAQTQGLNFAFEPTSDAEFGEGHRQLVGARAGLDAARGIGVNGAVSPAPVTGALSTPLPSFSRAGTASVISGGPGSFGDPSFDGKIGLQGGGNYTAGLSETDKYKVDPNAGHFSGGTAEVKAPMSAPAPHGAPQPQQMGLLDHMQGIVHHAMHALHASSGMANVPSPGQTQGSGSWEGPQPTMSTPMPSSPSPSGTPNQDLRAKMGYGVRASGGMTDVPMGPTGPAGPLEQLPDDAAGRMKVNGTQNYSGGTSKVPGKGNPGVDKVPAVLAPGEAVLNQGAATHMGRGAIAALNALGAHAMSQAGTPPMGPGADPATQMGSMPPGMGKPPMGKPAQGPQQKPIARGAPKPPPGKGAPKPPMMKGKPPMMKGKVAASSKGR